MKKLTLAKLGLAFVALVLATGCPPPPPLISLFTAAPDTIVAGGSATLVYTAAEGATLSIDNGVGDVTGTTQASVTPGATTTYTLTATKDGKSETASVIVTVSAAPSLISLFTAAPAAIAAGATTALVFTVAPGSALSIDNGVGDVTGRTQVDVTPGATTTYTLTATKDGRTATATTTVTVGATPPIGFTVTGLTTATAGVSGTATITAVNASGGTISTYLGTVHFTSDDAQAVLPADITFTAGDAGSKTVDVTFKTAGNRLLIANDTAGTSAQGFGRIAVSAGPASALAISAGGTSVAAGDGVAITVTARDEFGNQATGYTGTLQVTTGDPLASAPSTVTFAAGDQGRKTFGVSFGLAGSWTVTTTDTATATLTATTSSIAVGPGAIARIQLTGPASATADAAAAFTATALDRFGNVLTGYTGSIHVVHDDPSAPPHPDVPFTAAGNGVATFTITFFTAGDRTVSVVPAAGGGLAGSVSLDVGPGAVTHYALSALPASASAGDPIPLTITALDAHDNVVTSYTQQARVTSADATDQLPADTGFSGGVATVSLAFVQAGSHSVTVSEVGGTISAASTTTSVSPAAVAELALAGGGASGAGASSSFTITARDRYGNTVTGFTGTVTFSSTDPGATVPGAYAFVPGDNGSHAFNVTFETAGAQQLTASSAGLSAVGHFTVSPAAASRCALTGVAATAVAGAQLVPVVTFFDPFDNVATGYAGTVTLTSTATSAVLPPAATLGSGDAGSHAFQVQILSTGAASVTASDTAISCSANVSVTAAAARYTVTFAADANASWAANGTVTVKDLYGNAVTSYAGVLHFTSTDGAGVAPADITLSGSEGGVASFAFTFNTAGTQTLTVSDPSSGAQSGTAAVRVHGLTYTNPTTGTGKVRVVVNAAGSSASTVQLDVVSNTFTARVTNGTYIRGGVFSTGMNLPLSTSRVIAGTPLVAEPATLVIPTGAAPKAVAATLATSGPLSGQLLVALSGKRVGAGGTVNDNGMVVGNVIYSVKLKIAQGATVGTVFDGNSLPGTFRAAVRSITGDDVVGQEGFVLGKLEVL